MLEKATYPRKISSSETISIYEKPFSVGHKFKGQVVLVLFSSKNLPWLCHNREGKLLKTIKDNRFSKENLYSL